MSNVETNFSDVGDFFVESFYQVIGDFLEHLYGIKAGSG